MKRLGSLLSCLVILAGCIDSPYWEESFRIESDTVLQFGEDETITTLPLTIKDASKIAYKAQSNKDWVSFDNNGTGEFKEGENNTLFVHINRRKMDEGKNSTYVSITADSSPSKRIIPLEAFRRADILIDKKSIELGNEKMGGSFKVESHNGSYSLRITGVPHWMTLSTVRFKLLDNGEEVSSKDISFTIDRSQLPEGLSKVELTIASEGGTFSETLEISVNQPSVNVVNASAGFYNMSLTKCFFNGNGITLEFSIFNSGKGSQISFTGGGYAVDENGTIFNISMVKNLTILKEETKNISIPIYGITSNSKSIRKLFLPASDYYDATISGFLFECEIILPWQ